MHRTHARADTAHDARYSAPAMEGTPRIAIVYDWLDTWGGGENVLAEVLREYPHADLFALVDFLPDELRSRLGGRRARTTFLQHVPGARRHFRRMLPLFPRAIESLDLAAYDLVLSLSHAVAKGARTTPRQLHICYCNTPMRYAWDLREQYLATTGLDRGLRGVAVRRMLDRLREWDRRTSDRVTHFIANSAFIAQRIERAYGREATVIHPPVDTAFFTPSADGSLPSRDYFLAASRFVPYKRIDAIAAAFALLPQERLVIAGDGPEAARIRAAAGPNARFVGRVTREEMRELLRNARALVFAAEEDFGILPVEAQACGTPVIAYGKGGVLETVDTRPDHATGLFFASQGARAIADAVAAFDAHAFAPIHCRAHAIGFSTQRFTEALTGFVASAWRGFARPG